VITPHRIASTLISHLDPHQQRQVSFQMMFEGYPTNVTVTSFSDTIMINISQTNKMGTILSASRILPADVSGSGQGSFNVYTLMGYVVVSNALNLSIGG